MNTNQLILLGGGGYCKSAIKARRLLANVLGDRMVTIRRSKKLQQ